MIFRYLSRAFPNKITVEATKPKGEERCASSSLGYQDFYGRYLPVLPVEAQKVLVSYKFMRAVQGSNFTAEEDFLFF